MKGIIGAIAGDIIGSTHEFRPIKTKEFSLFNKRSTFTDDTIMTLAVAKWLINDRDSKEELIKQLQYFGNKYPHGGYGRMFKEWLQTENPKPYAIRKELKEHWLLQMLFIWRELVHQKKKLKTILK